MTPEPTRFEWTLELDEAGVVAIAGLLAADLRRGDCIALVGDLGAGKTTLARAMIRAALGDENAEVPSPTFSLAQAYDTPRLAIAHFDFYRLANAHEALEIGFDEAHVNGAVLVEWPERAHEVMPADRLEITLTEIDGAERRRIVMTGQGAWRKRLERLAAIRRFIENSGWGNAQVRPLAGDASTRRYMRVVRNGEIRVLMDAPRMPDGLPIRDGLPYSRIAHLAEDVRPFVAIGRYLKSLGLSVPEIYAFDLEGGLLLIEDLGDRVFGIEIGRGTDQTALWRTAAEALHVIRRAGIPSPLPVGDGTMHDVPAYDRNAMQIEVELLADWYVPAATGSVLPASVRQDFLTTWLGLFDQILNQPKALVLRDFHSPNLIALPGRTGIARTGVIDFQDALIGHPAYDLVSLLQDARVDVDPTIEKTLLDAYIAAASSDPGFNADGFRLAYAVLGAQRNTKILGIFARLAKRDGKPVYLKHIPRIWRYLEHDLAHPALSGLSSWYEQHLPSEIRSRAIEP
ncbi:MAG: tRNA (adenosine(37)-N6)-threonylcarbamoyltransferase complex ATPase subunit type 1 TsaE [Hyphomicrobiaceae bacterium]